MSDRALRTSFTASFFLLCGLLEGCTVSLLFQQHNSNSLVPLVVLMVMNIGIAHNLTELAFGLCIRPSFPPKGELPQQTKDLPQVAMLYLTCDDFMEVAVDGLSGQDYPNLDIFILDDSQDPAQQRWLDQTGYKVVRRFTRKGYKAGNLNYWLSQYGSRYEFFIVLDSDSLVPANFVGELVRYALHPQNQHIAVFQSRLRAWGAANRFTRTVASWFPLFFFSMERLANRMDASLPMGHNCLFRTHAIEQVYGFQEDYIAEDYATGLRLVERGYRCRMVDLISYETVPANIYRYTRRNIRWATQTLQLFQMSVHGIPFTTWLHICMNAYSFLIWIAYLPGMVFAVWGRQAQQLLAPFYQPGISPGEILTASLFVFYTLYFLLLKLPLALHLGLTLRQYFGGLLLFISMSAYQAVPLAVGQIKMMLGIGKPAFFVSGRKILEKQAFSPDVQILTGLCLTVFLAAGVVRSPAVLLLNASWLLPMLWSPALIDQVDIEN
jgi:cellulose synthase/poly-beta-1,6-N-acetylglucosamine synthase-like glycosyltransferase